MSEALEETLKTVKAHGPINAPNVSKSLGIEGLSVSAVNNRLEDLRNLGFLDRRRTHGGFGWTYFLKRNHYRKKP